MSTKVSDIFSSNSIWKVLSLFLRLPSSQFYVKELSRELRMGATTANDALQALHSMGLLNREDRARSHFYSLNNESQLARQLKTALFLARLQDQRLVEKSLAEDEDIISLCLYGSFATGLSDEHSDVDILVISQKPRTTFDSVASSLESHLKLPVRFEVFSLSAWQRLKKEDSGFYREILQTNVLLYGSELI
jgi:predicted nucleotidyltransferase